MIPVNWSYAAMMNSHLTDAEWSQATRIADTLHRKGCDRNELRKILTIVRTAEAMSYVMELQQERLNHSEILKRSDQTVRYWRDVLDVTRPLANAPVERAAMILGWAARILAAKPATRGRGQ